MNLEDIHRTVFRIDCELDNIYTNILDNDIEIDNEETLFILENIENTVRKIRKTIKKK